MTQTAEPQVTWSQEKMVEIRLNEPDDFLKVRETLTRIGVASRKEKKLYQSCHILHKQGKYFIVHFKELFALDGKRANITVNDVQRRNRIIKLLQDWGLVTVLTQENISNYRDYIANKIFNDSEKVPWTTISKAKAELVKASNDSRFADMKDEVEIIKKYIDDLEKNFSS